MGTGLAEVERTGREPAGTIPAQLLFEEARQRRRRRRRRVVAGVVALGLAGLALATTFALVAAEGGGKPSAPPEGPRPLAGAAHGTVTGELELDAGLAAAGFHPLPGTVEVTGAHGQAHVVRVGSDGSFTLRLPRGTYRVTGRSPLYVPGPGMACRGRSPVVVRAGHTSRVAVVCEGM